MADSNNIILANMYFDINSKNAEGKVKCRKCDAMCKDNSGHGNLASHVKTKHSACWQEELKQHLQGATCGASGKLESFISITKVVSDEAKNINSWIEWIVLADLPIYVVENEHYRKNSRTLSVFGTLRRRRSTLIQGQLLD